MLVRLLFVLGVLAALAGCGESPSSAPADATSDGSETPVEDTTSDTDADGSDVVEEVEPADVQQDLGADDVPGELGDADGSDVTDANSADSDALADADADADEETTPDVSVDTTPDPMAPCPAVRELTVYRPDLVADAGWSSHAFSRCAPTAHRLVIPAGSTWRIDVERLPAGGRLFAFGAHYHLRDAGLAAPEALAVSEDAVPGVTTFVRIAATIGGEHVVLLDRPDLRTTTAYELRAVCETGCDREATRFPVAFLHGYAGVDSYFGILDYFHDIRPLLQGRGYQVLFPVSDPIARSEDRASQLIEQLQEMVDTTGARQIHLIAHSQGGLDARLLAHRGEWSGRIASITTVATPHRGIPLTLADFLSVQDFSPQAMETFNRAYPDLPGIAYFSWSFRSCGPLDRECQRNSAGESIDALLLVPFGLLGRFGDNDGIVPTDSMPWGEHLGLMFADHFDEVGQIADRVTRDDPFDHRAFYLGEVRRLRDAGW